MRVEPTSIPDVLVVEPKVFEDARGFFYESWNRRAFAQAGIGVEFVQDNHSCSQRGVLRGLHYQIEHAQGKLVRVIEGEVFDVAVDLRRSSPTFGRHVAIDVSAANALRASPSRCACRLVCSSSAMPRCSWPIWTSAWPRSSLPSSCTYGSFAACACCSARSALRAAPG